MQATNIACSLYFDPPSIVGKRVHRRELVVEIVKESLENLLHSIFNIVLVFIRHLEIETYLHSTFFCKVAYTKHLVPCLVVYGLYTIVLSVVGSIFSCAISKGDRAGIMFYLGCVLF
jgi:small-conductance mechanosensitive channel